MNKITKIISLGIVIAIFLISLVINPNSEPLDEITLDEITLDEITLDEITLDEITLDEITLDEITLGTFMHIIKKKNDINFDTYFTENDVQFRFNEVRFDSSEKLELEKLKPNKNTIVIYYYFCIIRIVFL